MFGNGLPGTDSEHLCPGWLSLLQLLAPKPVPIIRQAIVSHFAVPKHDSSTHTDSSIAH